MSDSVFPPFVARAAELANGERGVMPLAVCALRLARGG